MITYSFVMAVLQSYEMVERQCAILKGILGDHWELILVDDASNPEIPFPKQCPAYTKLTRMKRGYRQRGEWTQKRALNDVIALHTMGKYIVKNDIDHVFTPEAIAAVERFTGDMMLFNRRAGRLRDDLSIEPLPDKVHSPVDDIWIMRRELFLSLGGYPKEFERTYGGAGKCFWQYSRKPEAQPPEDALIYVVPDTYATYHSLPRVEMAQR